MTFTITRLANQRALVKGTDVLGSTGETVISTQQWDEINLHNRQHEAEDAFAAEVEKFFEPLTKAADAMHVNLQQPRDPASFIVIHEGVEPTPGEQAHVVQLSPDSVVLRLVEQGNTDRLVWVDGELELLAYEETVPANGAGEPDVEPDWDAINTGVSGDDTHA